MYMYKYIHPSASSNLLLQKDGTEAICETQLKKYKGKEKRAGTLQR